MADQVSSPDTSRNYIELAADVVSAFVSNNSVPAIDLPALIGSVHSALQNVGTPAQTQPTEKPTPAVPVRKSITPDAIISLEDGKPYKSLKRHLTGHRLTPAQYQAKWGLPHDYPMVAPGYAAKRSKLARQSGHGQQCRKSADAADTASGGAPRKRGRKKAA